MGVVYVAEQKKPVRRKVALKISGRSCFGWPGCPPRFFFDLRFRDGGLACGCRVLGGSEEFRGVLPCTCRRGSSTSASTFAILASSARIIA